MLSSFNCDDVAVESFPSLAEDVPELLQEAKKKVEAKTKAKKNLVLI